jgi:hypothetical protein
MIRSLDDAWKWYSDVRTLAFDMRRLAGKWDNPELREVLGRDNHLRERTSADLRDRANAILEDLDELAVLVLFSVFEVTVRDRARAEVERETASIRHPAVLRAVNDLKEAIESGSFGRITESYKALDADLTEQVNQVRRFRNWVAHGRRGRPKSSVDPRDAIARLRRYLALLAEAGGSATIEPAAAEPEPDAGPEQPPDVEPPIHQPPGE